MTKALRLNRLFRSNGRTVVCALDHSRMLYVPRLRAIAELVAGLADEGCDGFICNAGQIADAVAHVGRASLILSVRLGVEPRSIVDQCLRVGLDGVKAEVFPGLPGSDQALRDLEHLALECDRWGLLVVAEMVPGGFDAPEQHSANDLSVAARQARECGADVVKIPMVTSGSLSDVIAYSELPVTILGGPVVDGRPDFLEIVRHAIDEGAAGVIAGRFIFEDQAPRTRMADLIRLVHDVAPRRPAGAVS